MALKAQIVKAHVQCSCNKYNRVTVKQLRGKTTRRRPEESRLRLTTYLEEAIFFVTKYNKSKNVLLEI